MIILFITSFFQPTRVQVQHNNRDLITMMVHVVEVYQKTNSRKIGSWALTASLKQSAFGTSFSLEMIREDTKSSNSRDLNYLAPLPLLILAKQKQHDVQSIID